MIFATDIYDSLKNINPEVFDDFMIHIVGNLFGLAHDRRRYLKFEIKETIAYKELTRRYGEYVSLSELLGIVRIL